MRFRRLKLLVTIAGTLLGRLHARQRGAGVSGGTSTTPWVGIEGLEQRILFSAPGVGMELLAPPEIHDAQTTLVGAWDPSGSASLFGADTASSGRALFRGADTAPADVRRELVFVDAGVEDYQRLVDELLENAGDGLQPVVVLLESDRDGIAQIGEVLSGLEGLDAVHIVSHGSNGTVRLGNTSLDLDNLASYAETISDWRGALSDDADLLFYGCNLAAGEDGRNLVEALGRLTGADVAASTDLTGTARRGGDWDLEFSVGSIETAAAFSHQIEAGWAGLLATVTVTTTGDVNDGDTSSIAALIATPGADGVISLREAIIAANNSTGADTIDLLAGTYTLTGSSREDAGASGDLDIIDTAGLTINGAGAASTVIDGGGIDRVFDIKGKAEITGVTITNGFLANNSIGGGINIDAGDVTLTGVIITGNSAGNGAGIYSWQSTLTVTDSEIVGNSTPFWGGGFYNDGSTAILERVTISGNTAGKDGGGIYHAGSSSTLSLTNVTISGNTAAKGGGIYTNRSVSLTNSTVAFNSAATSGGGIHAQGAQGDAVLLNTILAFNTGGNASKALTSLGNNIDSGNTAGLTGPGDLVNTDPLLGSLQDNGGPTQTHALLSGSPAIDAGVNAGSPATDQRGFVSSDGTRDIGAYEFGATPNQAPTTGGISNVTVGEDAPDTAIDLFAAFDDAEDADTDLTYTIESNTNAALFSVTTIDGLAGTLTLAYAPDAPGTADITVRATDTAGSFVETTFTVTVNAVNDDPVLAVNAGWELFDTLPVTITSALLAVTDADNTPAELTYTLTGVPLRGALFLSGAALQAGDTFTQADIDNELLGYEFDGRDTGDDAFVFTVSDGAGGSIGSSVFNITVRVPDPTDPEPFPTPEPPESPDPGDPVDGGDDPIVDPVDPVDDGDDEDRRDDDGGAAPPPDLTGSDPESELDPLVPDDIGPRPRTGDPLATEPPPIPDDDGPDAPDSGGPARLAHVAHRGSQLQSLTVLVESRRDTAGEGLSFITQPNDLWDSLDMLEDQLQTARREDHLTAGAAAFVGLSLSVGYLVWTLRAGYLLSSLLTFMPAWKSIDPLPILEYYDFDSNDNGDDNGNGEDQETIDSLIPQNES